jgi:hypothetical protein
VVQLVALEPDLCALSGQGRFAQFLRQAGREIERAGATHIVLKQVVELRLKRRIGLGAAVLRLQFEHQWHQRFRNITPAKLAEMAAFIRPGLETVGLG